LIKKRNQLNALFKDNPIPMAMLDENMNYIFASDSWLNSFKNLNTTDIIGKNAYEVDQNTPHRWKMSHQRVLRGERVSVPRDQIINQDGSTSWLRWNANPWYESEGRVGGVIMSCEDISDEVMLNQKLKTTEGKYNDYFENSSMGWIEVDISELLANLNKKNNELSFEDFSELFTSTVKNAHSYNSQIMNLFALNGLFETDFNLLDYIAEDEDHLVHNLYNSLKNNTLFFEDEIQIVNNFEEVKHLYVSAKINKEADNGYILFGILDISDLKTSIRALRDSEERYRTIFDSNGLGIIYTNYEKNIVKVNDSFTKMLGYSETEMQTVTEEDILYPAYKKTNKKVYQDFREGIQREASLDKEYRTKKGERLIAKTASSALYNDNGGHYGTVTIIEDITERKIQESKIKRQNVELKKINRELDQFVYSAAHDLRAPIANVMGLVRLLRLEEVSDTAQTYLDLQEKSLAKLDDFIRSIVDFSKNSRSKLTKESIDFEHFITEIIDQYRYSESAQNVKISVTSDQNSTFHTDLSRFSIVMNNLISNAIRYSDPSKNDKFINIAISVLPKTAVIEVSDNGIGIEKEHLQNIFKLFYRASSNSKGTGIGLYIVKDTITKLKGSLKVNSTFGEGSVFTVTLKNIK
jgi:PAS domain S-box-containing protein